jgi:DnaJ domain
MAQGRAVACPYAMLDIAPGATRDEIRQAFRLRAKQTHPDHGGDRCAFEAVRSAYLEVLAAAPVAELTIPVPLADKPIVVSAPLAGSVGVDARTATVHRSYRTTTELDLTAVRPRRRSSVTPRPMGWGPPARSGDPAGTRAPSAFSSMLADALTR